MSILRHITWSVALASTAFTALAQTQTAAEHAQHHPVTVAQAQTPAQPAMPKGAMAPKAGAANPMPAMAAMEDRMKAMQAMHEKMANAKTPEERNALMAEQMKTMQDSMAMMNQMGGMGGMGGMQGGKAMPGNMAERQQMMEKRMDMMQMKMDAMMKNQSGAATPMEK